MRIMAKLTGSATAVALGILLTACGGGTSNTSSSTATVGGSSTANAVAPTAAPARDDAGHPAQPVCDVFSKSDISKLIGVPVLSSNDVDISAGAQPTVCFYYTNPDETDYIEIHWMTLKEAAWDQQLQGIGTVDSGGMKTVMSRYPGLGDDALKGVATFENRMTVSYQVMLRQRGLVIDFVNATNLPDANMLNLIRGALPTVNKL